MPLPWILVTVSKFGRIHSTLQSNIFPWDVKRKCELNVQCTSAFLFKYFSLAFIMHFLYPYMCIFIPPFFFLELACSLFFIYILMIYALLFFFPIIFLTSHALMFFILQDRGLLNTFIFLFSCSSHVAISYVSSMFALFLLHQWSLISSHKLFAFYVHVHIGNSTSFQIYFYMFASCTLSTFSSF